MSREFLPRLFRSSGRTRAFRSRAHARAFDFAIFRGAFKIPSAVALYHQWTTRALYTIYSVACTCSTLSKSREEKQRRAEVEVQQLVSPQHLAASDMYIRHRHAPLPILDVLSCVLLRLTSASLPRLFPIFS